MTEQQSQSMLTFFQFALLNQVQAVEAAQLAHQKVESLLNRKSVESFDVAMVQATSQVLNQVRKSQKATGKSANVQQSAFAGSGTKADLSPWRDYFKNASSEEVSVVIWAHILKIPLPEIARGLSLTTGTLVHRLSRGVRRLSVKLDNNPTLQARRPWN